MRSKSIDVNPIFLLPDASEILKVQTKRVDYSFALVFPDRLQAQDILREFPIGERSFCQFDNASVYLKHLFSHVEVKRRLNTRDGEVQLGVWTAAGLKRLHSLCLHRSKSLPQGNIYGQMPPIPLWSVVDDSWNLSIAIQRDSSQLTILGPVINWTTKEQDSLIKLIITVNRVMQWGVDEYCPWFYKQIAYNNT